MKIKLFFLMVLATMNVCLGQETTSEKSSKDYKKEGNTELIIGSVLVAGSVLVLANAAQGDVKLDSLPMVIVGGALLMGGGIAILSSSGNSFKKARELSANLDYKPMEIQRFSSRQMAGVPVVSIRIKF